MSVMVIVIYKSGYNCGLVVKKFFFLINILHIWKIFMNKII